MLHASSLETFLIVLLTSFWFFSLRSSIMIEISSSAPFFPLSSSHLLSLSSSLNSSSIHHPLRLSNRHIIISLFFFFNLYGVDSFVCQSNPHVSLSNPFPSSILLKVETFHSFFLFRILTSHQNSEVGDVEGTVSFAAAVLCSFLYFWSYQRQCRRC